MATASKARSKVRGRSGTKPRPVSAGKNGRRGEKGGSMRVKPPSKRPPSSIGMAVELAIRSFDGVNRDEKSVEIADSLRRPKGSGGNGFPLLKDREMLARRVARSAKPESLSRLLAPLAHPQRIRILLKLLGGEATHQLLSKATKLKAGPLYHHLRELRAAGFIGPKVRDVYTLSLKGRRAILATLAVGRLCG